MVAQDNRRWSLRMTSWGLRSGVGEDFVGAGGAPGFEFVAEFGARGGEDLGGEECGVGGSGFADGECADGNPFGHLHDREKRIDSVEKGSGNGHAENGDGGLGSDHAGKMGGASGGSDDHLKSTGFGGRGVFEHPVGGAMGGDDADLVRDGELGEDVDGRLHGVEVGARTHDDADERSGHGGSIG
jgi:hypothetical protein